MIFSPDITDVVIYLGFYSTSLATAFGRFRLSAIRSAAILCVA
jgi:hypothetical protein